MVKLTHDRRQQCRRAVGDALVARATALAEDRERAHGTIRLHDWRVHEETKIDWLTDPITRLYDGLAGNQGLDLGSDAIVGRELRPALAELLRAADEADELADFLALFDSETTELFGQLAAEGVSAAALFVLAITAETDTDADAAGGAFTELAQEIEEENRVILSQWPSVPNEQVAARPQSGREELSLIVGLDEADVQPDWIDTIQTLRARGRDLVAYGAAQLGYLGPFRPRGIAAAISYFDIAVRLATGPFPLLAHRAALLTTRLFQRALAADQEATLEAVGSFFTNEAQWIIAAGPRFETALDRHHSGDLPAIFEAYREICEGMLRRFGSLLLALDAVANGGPAPSPIVLQTIGFVSEQLRSRTDPVARLLARFTAPGLRNAGAHANVAITSAGDLLIRADDGSTAEIHPNELYAKTLALRAAMGGVDVAFNIILPLHVEPSGKMSLPPFFSAEGLLHMARIAAQETTRGTVTDLEARDGTMTLTFEGEANTEEVALLCLSFARVLDDKVRTLRVVDGGGDLRYQLERQEASERDPLGSGLFKVSRNDPCPCGSGRKYKRCHGR